MPTSDAADIPRDARGKWRRQVESVDRDAKAALMAAQGAAYSQIAAELGYSCRQDAYRGAQRALSELASVQRLSELREQQIVEIAELRRVMWQTVEDPPVAFDRLGRPVKDDDGNPVPDEQARQGAAQTILRAEERLAKLTGMDAPRRSMSAAVDVSTLLAGDVSELLAQLRQIAGPEMSARVDRVIQMVAGEIESA